MNRNLAVLLGIGLMFAMMMPVAAQSYIVATRIHFIEADSLSLTANPTEQENQEIWIIKLQFTIIEQILVTADDPVLVHDTGCGLVKTWIGTTGFANIDFQIIDINCRDHAGDWAVRGKMAEVYTFSLYNSSTTAIQAENITGQITLNPSLLIANSHIYESVGASIKVTQNQVSEIHYDNSTAPWDDYDSGNAQYTNTSKSPASGIMTGLLTIWAIRSVIMKYSKNRHISRQE